MPVYNNNKTIDTCVSSAFHYVCYFLSQSFMSLVSISKQRRIVRSFTETPSRTNVQHFPCRMTQLLNFSLLYVWALFQKLNRQFPQVLLPHMPRSGMPELLEAVMCPLDKYFSFLIILQEQNTKGGGGGRELGWKLGMFYCVKQAFLGTRRI